MTASWPPFITVGKPFTLQLRASNATQHVLDLSLRLGDTTGFMLAGTPKSLPPLAEMLSAVSSPLLTSQPGVRSFAVDCNRNTADLAWHYKAQMELCWHQGLPWLQGQGQAWWLRSALLQHSVNRACGFFMEASSCQIFPLQCLTHV